MSLEAFGWIILPSYRSSLWHGGVMHRLFWELSANFMFASNRFFLNLA
jgi:hypothetical protein